MKHSRRDALAKIALSAAALSFPNISLAETKQQATGNFRYCLNTSTISGQKPSMLQYIDIAAAAGYDGIEVWVRDIKAYLAEGNKASELKKYIEGKGLKVENAIGFAPWIAGGEKGMQQMQEEMEMLAAIGGSRIAAPPAGVPDDKPLDFLEVGERYAAILELGRKTGVMPQLEFWGASKSMWHLGQIIMVATATGDTDARLLPDIYHLFRGGSGFEGLKMLDGQMIEIFHMNDYPGTKAREIQVDADRIYPGDGVAPLTEVLTTLKNMGGEKVLSLELFNRSYWRQDAFEVAKTGLAKMKAAVAKVK
jgi:sugar phosphate isomerase/epimerase